MSLSAGQRLGPYEIVSAIGAGGMGEVYRAKDTALNRDVAIKVLPELFAADPERLARFTREAQTLASLNHPNIAAIYGIQGDGPGLPPGEARPLSGETRPPLRALVMELVEGDDLSVIIARGPMALADALPIAKQITTALEAAHEAGVIHRDLKPANIKVRHDGTVKVLDFGLAKAMDPSSSSNPDVLNSPTMTARATQMGMILGTAAYMAPEQAKGRAVDKRADIWAFGVVLFEMLAGRRAFTGEDVSDVLAAVLRQEIDWSALPPDTPPKVRRVLEHCLQRDPKLRLRDIGDAWIGMDVPDQPASATAVVAAPPASAISRSLPWAVALVIAIGSVTWTLLRTPAPEPRPVVRSAQLLKDLSIFVNVSRDGSRVAYAVASAGNSGGIVLRMLDQFEGRVIPGTEGGAFPVFSPDGQWIAYSDLAQPKIKKIPVTGGTSIPICEGNFLGGAAWGDDNTLVFSGAKGLMRVSADGGTPEAITTVDTAKGETSHTRPQFLPGGKQLLFTVITSSGPQFAMHDLDKTGHRLIAKGGINGQYAVSGHLTYMRGTTLLAVPFDLKRMAVAGGEVPVVESVSTIGPQDTGDYSISSTGVLAYFSDAGGGGTTLGWADRTGATKPLPGDSRRVWATGRLSPDGCKVANGIQVDNGSDVWVLDVARGTPTRVTFGGINDNPVWTPDNKRVYYTGIVDGKAGLYMVPADNSTKAVLVLATDSPAVPTSFTPDGKTLIFTQSGQDKRPRIQLLTLPTDGQPGQPHPLHEASGGEGEAQISPDGHWVAYTSSESGTAEIYVQAFPAAGARTRVSSAGGGRSRWSRDGHELFYWESLPTATLMAVDVTTTPALHVGEPHKLFQMVPGTTFDTTPDKNKFLVELTSTAGGSTLSIVTNWLDELRRRAPAKK
jgi:Tol biopolymer transport system component